MVSSVIPTCISQRCHSQQGLLIPYHQRSGLSGVATTFHQALDCLCLRGHQCPACSQNAWAVFTTPAWLPPTPSPGPQQRSKLPTALME